MQGAGSGIQIGLPGPTGRNVISGNGADGVRVVANVSGGLTIVNNFIDTDVTGTARLANAGNGVFLQGGGGNIVGGDPAAGGT